MPESSADPPFVAEGHEGNRGGKLRGRVALIAGASRGIGLAIARVFLEAGATVCLAARNRDQLVAAMRDLPGTAIAHELDVESAADCRRAVAEVTEQVGPIDILVNSAGVLHRRPFLEYGMDEPEKSMRVNFYGPWHLMQAVLGGMVQRGYGRIINVGSTSAKWASPDQAAYNSSKHALIGLTRCVALETASTGVTVNAICPGLVDTDMVAELCAAQVDPTAFRKHLESRVPARRLLAPAEVAALALYLASDEAAGMTGQSIVLDGGTLFV